MFDWQSDDSREILVMDLIQAYDVPTLTKLERTFTYSREGGGSFTVSDAVAFAEEGRYKTALVTFDDWEKVDDSTLIVGEGDSALRVVIDTGGVPFHIDPVVIDEDMQVKIQPLRLGIVLEKPVTSAVVAVTIEGVR